MTADPAKLPCPFCGAQDSRTVQTRWWEVSRRTWRRRHCQTCGARFSSVETYLHDEPALRLNPGRFAPAST